MSATFSTRSPRQCLPNVYATQALQIVYSTAIPEQRPMREPSNLHERCTEVVSYGNRQGISQLAGVAFDADTLLGMLQWARKNAGLDPYDENAGGPTELVSFHNCFHGRTMGALALTYKKHYKTPFLPLIDGAR